MISLYTVEVGDPAGGDYDALTNADTADVSVTNFDDDTAAVTVSAISGDTAEAGTSATFSVVLTSQPSADVTIPILSLDTTEGTVDAGQPDLYQRQLGYGPDRDGHRRQRRRGRR